MALQASTDALFWQLCIITVKQFCLFFTIVVMSKNKQLNNNVLSKNKKTEIYKQILNERQISPFLCRSRNTLNKAEFSVDLTNQESRSTLWHRINNLFVSFKKYVESI